MNLVSFRIVALFELYWKYHNFERNEICAIVFLKWTDFKQYQQKRKWIELGWFILWIQSLGRNFHPSSISLVLLCSEFCLAAAVKEGYLQFQQRLKLQKGFEPEIFHLPSLRTSYDRFILRMRPPAHATLWQLCSSQLPFLVLLCSEFCLAAAVNERLFTVSIPSNSFTTQWSNLCLCCL